MNTIKKRIINFIKTINIHNFNITLIKLTGTYISTIIYTIGIYAILIDEDFLNENWFFKTRYFAYYTLMLFIALFVIGTLINKLGNMHNKDRHEEKVVDKIMDNDDLFEFEPLPIGKYRIEYDENGNGTIFRVKEKKKDDLIEK